MQYPNNQSFLKTHLNNLLEIRPDFSEQEILAALEKVGLQKFIDQSPNGTGTNLSSTKLGIILVSGNDYNWHRASLSLGNLILMDEPTEGLDTAGAAVFYDYLNDCIEAQKTVVVSSFARPRDYKRCRYLNKFR